MPVQTPLGNASAKVAPGKTWRRHIRIEKIARLCKDGFYSNAQIAAHLGLNVQTVVTIKTTKEFQAKMIELTTGVLSDYDQDLREIAENSKEELAAMVPLALLGLRNCLLSKNQNIALAAAKEVLDREGTNAKISKVTVHQESKPDISKVNATAFDIMALLGRPVGEEVQVELSGGFTVSATEHRAQTARMSEAIDEKALEELDLSKTTKQ